MQNNKNNKILIIILMIFIAFLVLINFILSEPKYEITIEIIICLCLLTILALSEVFDNLSIPKLISLSKNIKEVRKENDNLKESNIKLLEQITNIKNSNNQTIVLPNSFNTISSSNIDDVNNNEKDLLHNQEEDTVMGEQDTTRDDRKIQQERYKYRKNIEVFVLRKALDLGNGLNENIKYDVKLINNNFENNNIMKNEVRFDALKSSEYENIFYEIKCDPFVLDYSYQLHYMLRTLELYEEANKIHSKLILILPKIDKKLETIMYKTNRDRFNIVRERLEKRFEPAIRDNLLEILEIEVTKNELDKYIKEKETNK